MKWNPIFVALSLLFFITFSNASSKTENNLNDTIQYENNHKELTLLEAADAIKWEMLAVSGAGLYLGLRSWNWGSSNSFKFHNEGFFGMDTASAGADKLGHLYGCYVINEFFTKRLFSKTDDKKNAALYSALFSSAFGIMVEVFDAYSVDHGFSYEDILFNSLGIGISYFKNTIPGLDEKLDLRVKYQPSKKHSDHPITDYSGYTYMAALKLGGFKELKDTPLKYLELHLGYHVEGFLKGEREDYPERKTQVVVGIGVDLSELLFKPIKKHTDNPLADYADTFFRYYQPPGVSVSVPIHERTRSY